MSGSFGGLSTALSSLYAQRRGLEVAGQNIANANTEGYSRQRLGLISMGAPVRPAIFAVGDPTAGGVRTAELTRMRDEFLEARARAEHSSDSFLTNKKEIFAKIEQVVGEPSDTGIQSQFSEYWAAWHSLTNRPGDASARAELLQRGTTLTDSIRSAYTSVTSLWDSTRDQIGAYVTEINTNSDTIAQLNEAIVRTKQAGMPANELADQRDLAVQRLGELTGGQAMLRVDGSVDVLVNGSSLVNGTNARHLEAYGATRLVDQAGDPVGLRWTDTGADASIPSGSLAAGLESLTTTLIGVAASLDDVAANLATSVNTQHAAGFDLLGAAGGDFFSGTTAATIEVAITDPDLVAAAGLAPTPPDLSSLDAQNADAIAALATTTTGPDARYRKFVVDLGIQAQSINRRAEIQTAITEDADSARISQSGVSLDEEMTSMITYQRAYEAAAKVMSTIDGTLDTLINSLKR